MVTPDLVGARERFERRMRREKWTHRCVMPAPKLTSVRAPLLFPGAMGADCLLVEAKTTSHARLTVGSCDRQLLAASRRIWATHRPAVDTPTQFAITLGDRCTAYEVCAIILQWF